MATFTVKRKSSGAPVGLPIEASTYYLAMQIWAKQIGMNYNTANRQYYLEEEKPELFPVDEEAETKVIPSMDDMLDMGEVEYFGLPMDKDFL